MYVKYFINPIFNQHFVFMCRVDSWTFLMKPDWMSARKKHAPKIVTWNGEDINRSTVVVDVYYHLCESNKQIGNRQVDKRKKRERFGLVYCFGESKKQIRWKYFL